MTHSHCWLDHIRIRHWVLGIERDRTKSSAWLLGIAGRLAATLLTTQALPRLYKPIQFS